MARVTKLVKMAENAKKNFKLSEWPTSKKDKYGQNGHI